MTIAQYLPQWLRRRWGKPPPPKARNISKKDRPALPTVPKSAGADPRADDEANIARFRIYWRM
jgi:hypothetical protein